ncbi:MAG: 50S ribosomal protein L24 [Actinomycetota bacterium]|jgi:large subunit ribosomal protein L24|nr:50S ribosomal protein L24 [Actinomycetota bacterium]
MKIHRGDNVIVLSGKDKGRRGEVVRALPKEGRVIVEGVNRVKRHQRTTQVRKRAGIIDKDLAVPVSKVALVCPKEHAPTRVRYSFGADGAKQRVCARCGEAL